MKKISIDTATEILSYLLAKKITRSISLAEGKEKELLNTEIGLLQKERNVIYGSGTQGDFEGVMQRIINVYAPSVKDAIARKTSIGVLSQYQRIKTPIGVACE